MQATLFENLDKKSGCLLLSFWVDSTISIKKADPVKGRPMSCIGGY